MLRWVAILLTVLLIALQYRLWMAEGSIRDLWAVEEEVKARELDVQRLEERNRVIEAEVIDLKTGLDAIEARARSELGLIGEDEMFFQVIEPVQPESTTPRIFEAQVPGMTGGVQSPEQANED
ncbi:MAG: cell division protein FtsB [Halothiobacillaceae bacterium]